MKTNNKIESSAKCCWFSWHVFGVILIILATVIFLFFPELFQHQLTKNFVLTPESRSYSEWKKPTIPLYMDVYVFNWTNPHEIKNKSTKPNFQQLGPYRFRVHPDKLNIKFFEHNSTVSYNMFSKYFFEPDGSNGSLSDIWTTINMVPLGAGKKAENWGYFRQKAVSMAFSTYKEEVHITKTIQELLFDGYEDDMVKLSTIFTNDTPFTRVGYLITKNRTNHLSGLYNVNTGAENISELGSIKRFNHLSEFPKFKDECRNLKGSAGEFFPPNSSSNESIYLFLPEMCRSIPYEYEKEVTLHGLIGRRFSVGSKALDNGTIHPENKCYANQDDVMPSGQFNITTCNYDFPIYMSLPHFYNADQFYIDAVDGMNPVKEKHENFITLDQKTGITLEVTARFQTNLLLRDYGEYINLYQDVPRVFMPIFYVEQKFIMDDDKASQIKLALNIPFIGQIIGVIIFALGIFMISFHYFKSFFTSKTSNDSKSLPLKPGATTVIRDVEMNPLMKKTNLKQ
ncbi:CLUMA_CG015303, isoform A [Clunio marinus]|uniref:CLUMA_CG015303, isoform A n=1 Tax=Clunio marinus TaxID=568069 RepID=A0A1J1IP86_9DIPT|nr:CLUMA_CG015303, isoform A [Clunio marinus]